MYIFNNFLVLLILLYLILRSHGVVQVLPGIWILPLVIIGFFSVNLVLSDKGEYLNYLLKESKWIILSFFILITYKLFDYGNFKLSITFSYLLTSLPFYIIGYYKGVRLNNIFIKKIVIGYLVFLFFYLMPKIILVLSSGSFNAYLFNQSFVNNEEDKGFLFFLPFISFVTVYGFFLLSKSKYRSVKIFAYGIFFTNLTGLFISSKAGPIFVLLVAFVFYYLKKGNKIISKYRNIFFSMAIVFILLFTISSGILGELGSLKSKTVAFTNLLESGFLVNDEVLNRITSDRWSLDLHSINQFLRKPIFGHGAYLDSVEGMLGESAIVTSVAGGHSFVFDTLAYYGLFGFPIIFILIKFIKDAIKYYDLVKKYKQEANISLIYASLFFGIFIANVLNTGFLFSSFDNFLFLLAGFHLGKYFNLKKIKHV